jgi:hypothetical protein
LVNIFTTLGVTVCTIGATDRFSDGGIVPATDRDPINAINAINPNNLQLIMDIMIPLLGGCDFRETGENQVRPITEQASLSERWPRRR